KAKDDGQARLTDEQALELLAMFLTAQQGAPGQVAQAPEAGVKFWEAYKAMQAGNYAAAAKAMEEARKIHEDRRWTRLRKAQNPYSDPTEEIFLRSAQDLATYIKINEKFDRLRKSHPDMNLLQLVDLAVKAAETPGGELLAEIAKELGCPNTKGDVL